MGLQLDTGHDEPDSLSLLFNELVLIINILPQLLWTIIMRFYTIISLRNAPLLVSEVGARFENIDDAKSAIFVHAKYYGRSSRTTIGITSRIRAICRIRKPGRCPSLFIACGGPDGYEVIIDIHAILALMLLMLNGNGVTAVNTICEPMALRLRTKN